MKRFFRKLRIGGQAAAKLTKTAVITVNQFATNTETHEAKPTKLFGRTVTFGVFIALMALVLIIALMAFNSRTVRVSRETMRIAGLPSALEGYRILHLSDLNATNFGQGQSTLLREIAKLKYDIVVVTGDMVGDSGNPAPFLSLLDGLGSSKKVYYIAGDADPSPLRATARENADETKTLYQMVYADWILAAQDRGATYVDIPIPITVGNAKLWLAPDRILGLNLTHALNNLKDQLAQEQEGMLAGVQADYASLPFTNYRYNIMYKTSQAASTILPDDLLIVLSHEVPLDAQISVAQDINTGDPKDYLPSPDILLAGHYCGGVWKLPSLGALHIPSNLSPRHGWFPDSAYVEGQRAVGTTSVYVSAGLSTSSESPFPFRLLNQPQVTLITLSGVLPSSILD